MSESSENSSSPLKTTGKQKRLLISTSDSDSDDSSLDRTARKKKVRVILSDDDSSSGSSIVANTSRRSTRQLRSDDSSDWSVDGSDQENSKGAAENVKKDCPPNNNVDPVMSDSSEGSSEKCPICLLSFSSQEIGTPSSCQHVFCVECITEWSKNVNTCPVDRSTFDFIVVRRKVGGKVLKQIPVFCRRPSEDVLVEEDPTFCEICGSADREDCMLLCDVCDLGFHMHCLSPPLEEVPTDEWFCPDCLSSELADAVDIYATEVDDLWDDLEEIGRPIGPRPSFLRSVYSRDSGRRTRERQSREFNYNAPSTSRNSVNTAGSSSSSNRRRRNPRMTINTDRAEVNLHSGVRRMKNSRKKRRRTRTVIVEYDVDSGDKFPKIRKKVTLRRRKTKRRKVRSTRQPRTAARRNHVRASVRARLANQFAGTETLTVTVGTQNSVTELSLQRYRAGIPNLSLFGRRDELEYFSGDDEISNGIGGTTVSVVPRESTSATLQAYRQARRKMISISTPACNNSSVDLLSSIMESQELIHSKSSKLSLTKDGKLKIDVDPKQTIKDKKNDKINVNNSDEAGRTVPAYPGSGRGGNWNNNRGGSSYQQNNTSSFHRSSNSYGNNSFGGNSYGNDYNDNSNFQGNSSFAGGNNSWHGNVNQIIGGYSSQIDRRRDSYNNSDRFPPRGGMNFGRGRNSLLRHSIPNRQSLGSGWQPPFSNFDQHVGDYSSNRNSFGGFDNVDPLDMTVGQNTMNISPNDGCPLDIYADIDAPSSSQEFSESTENITQQQEPEELLEPPVIRFEKPVLSEDEKSDSGLIIDTEKYDPMEPTIGDSDDESRGINISMHNFANPPPISDCQFQNDVTGMSIDNSTSLNVSDEVLGVAVQQVLQEHRNLLTSKMPADKLGDHNDSEDNDSDEGDCPNFSIYSTTSVSIANDNFIPKPLDCEQVNMDESVEDLVQEEDDSNYTEDPKNSDEFIEPSSEIQNNSILPNTNYSYELSRMVDIDEEVESKLNAMVSKRCPITPNKRTPIKIKLNSLSAIKKTTVDLYDAESVNLGELPSSQSNDKNAERSKFPQPENASVFEIHTGDNVNVETTSNALREISDDEFIPEMESINANDEERARSVSREDERSYTPCLDENKSFKSKDTSIESEKENIGIEGLDTEMISEDEGNDLFSDTNNQKMDYDNGALELSVGDTELVPIEFEEGEIVERNKTDKVSKNKIIEDEINTVSEDKKKKRKEKKIDSNKEKTKSKKKSSENVSFKKPSKNKDRNYRDKDDNKKNKSKDKRRSKSLDNNDKENREKMREKKRQKRKDLERYDVRTVVSEKRHRIKDAFGRDNSRPRSKSPSIPRSVSRGRSLSVRQSLSMSRRSLSRDRPPSHGIRRSVSRNRRSHSRLKFSPRRRSPTPRIDSFSPRNRRSVSPRPRRQITPRNRRSVSYKGRRSLSPRERRSVSPRIRQSVSPRKRRTASPKFKRSVSPRGRRSNSLRARRSVSLRGRRSISVRGRQSLSVRGRRSISPRVRRSASSRRRRSLTPLHLHRTPAIWRRRSLSKGRRRSRRPLSKLRKNSPKLSKPRRRRERRSRLKMRSLSRNRSKSPKPKKAKQGKTKRTLANASGKGKRSRSANKGKKLRKRTKSRSLTPAFSPSPLRDNLHPPPPPEWQEHGKSPLYQDWTSNSQSMSPSLMSPGWTPPAVDNSSPPRNLRVILANKDKQKKKEKRRIKHNKELDRMANKLSDIGPSKEVFTSGNNILVSVSFNKNQHIEGDPRTLPPEPLSKKRKRKADGKGKKDKKDKSKRRKQDRVKTTADTENKKPVAIIDLEKSPFAEITPSPKAVIVLSDSDNCEKEDELQRRQERIREELLEIGSPQPGEIISPVTRENVFVSSTGPKTPPEPTVKFSILTKSNPQLRPVNPLHEEEEEEEDNNDDISSKQTDVDKRLKEGTHKGPNTPPDPPNSPPSSPDAYDPFEPTKSGSVTPERPLTPVMQSKESNESESGNCDKTESSVEHLQKEDSGNSKAISPVEKVLSLLQSTRVTHSPTEENQMDSAKNVCEGGQTAISTSDISANISKSVSNQTPFSTTTKPNSPKPIFSTVIPTIVTTASLVYPNSNLPRIGTFTTSPNQRNNQTGSLRIVLPSSTKSSPLKTQAGKLFLAKPSPIKSTPIKPMPSKTIISKLPLPSIKPLSNYKKQSNKNSGRPAQNGTEIIDLDAGMDSPYSPGSSDFGDLFEPPEESNNKRSSNSIFSQNKASGKDIFDSLFRGKTNSSKTHKSSTAMKVPVKQLRKSKGKNQVGIKMDEDNLKILDDLPSSAVEMQFLKKLNRQERVVEEVKLVLKPHYNKKHVTKEEYKEILRRSVPKICHNRSGEINPAKIQALIEAYVKKFRKKTHQAK